MRAQFARLVFAAFCIAAPLAASQAQTVNVFIAGALNTPQGIARAANGNLYVTNAGNNTLSLVTPDGTVTTLVSSGLSAPNGVVIDSSGNILVANITGPSVVKVTPAGVVSTFADAGKGLGGPKGLAIDSAGNIYVSDIAKHAIFKFTPAGAVSTFVGDGNGLVTPASLVFDTAGNLYVTDPATAKITKVTPSGLVSVFASGFLSGEGSAFDLAGNLYTTDDANGKIYKISPAGVKSDFVSTPGAWGIVADGAGNFYFDDYFDDAVKKVTGAGVVSTVATNALERPRGLVVGANGDLFVGNPFHTLYEVTPRAQISTFLSGIGVDSLVRDGAGNIYAADNSAHTISKIAPNGTATPFATDVYGPLAIDGSGNIYGSGAPPPSITTGKIQKITPSGIKSDFAEVQSQTQVGMAADAGGNLYVASPGVNFSTVHLQPKITKITPQGSQTTIATGVSGPLDLDTSGNLYVGQAGSILRIAPDGTQTTLVSSPLIRSAAALVHDAIGNFYIADTTGNAILQVVVVSSPLLSAVLPGSRAVKVGAPATVFSTILNTGGSALNNCRMYLSGTAPSSLSLEFQTTNPNGNTLTGTKNQAVPIAANGSQSFVIGFNATGPVQLTAMPLVYACDGVSPAPTSPGVNTVDLLFSTSDIPDIIALAATATNDGILNIPFSQGQRGAFAVATANVGIAGTLTVTTDTAGVTLPVTPVLCPSDPHTAACLQAEAPTAQVTIAAGATPTFSVFVGASAAIPFAPQTARVYLRFLDSNGISHGSTSVAVRTQ